MGMLDRYKKTGGFQQLLQLIETSPQKKREQFLGLIAEESPVWEEHLRKKILSIEKIYSWDEVNLAEIFSRLQPLTLAVALHGTPQEEVDRLLNSLTPLTKRKIHDLIAEANPNPAEKATCLMKIITEVRGFVGQGLIKLDKIDAELVIPENIEEMLSNMSSGHSPHVIVIKGGNAVEHEPTTRPEPLSRATASAEGSLPSSQEMDLLKRKMNHLASEVSALKHENSLLKDKLAQIKKIA